MTKPFGGIAVTGCQLQEIFIAGNYVRRVAGDSKFDELRISGIARIIKLNLQSVMNVAHVTESAKCEVYLRRDQSRIQRNHGGIGQNRSIFGEYWPAEKKNRSALVAGVNHTTHGRSYIEKATQQDVRVQHNTKSNGHNAYFRLVMRLW